jgi:hypothetical protein
MNTATQTKNRQFTPDQVREQSVKVTNFHVLNVTYIPATNFHSSCVKIHSDRFKQSVLIDFNSEYDNTYEIAMEWILNNGFNVIGKGEATKGYYVITSTFEPLRK